MLSNRLKENQETMSEDISKSKSILGRWIEGVNGGALAEVQGLYSEGAVLVPTFSGEILGTPEGIAGYFVKITKDREVPAAERDETVVEQECGAGVSVIAGIYDWHIKEGGAKKSFAARFSYVLEPASERPVCHHHSSLVPE